MGFWATSCPVAGSAGGRRARGCPRTGPLSVNELPVLLDAARDSSAGSAGSFGKVEQVMGHGRRSVAYPVDLRGSTGGRGETRSVVPLPARAPALTPPCGPPKLSALAERSTDCRLPGPALRTTTGCRACLPPPADVRWPDPARSHGQATAPRPGVTGGITAESLVPAPTSPAGRTSPASAVERTPLPWP